MDLKVTYCQVLKRLKLLDFSSLYPSFRQYDFALYDGESVCINGERIDKTQEFIANTAIQYKGEYIAIWNLQNEMDIDVLTSKIVHEMFHAHQMNVKDQRFPNDLEALYRYEYHLENLSLKYEEHKMILNLLNSFSREEYQKLLSIRKSRVVDFPYETSYEMSIEEIEGTANYIELEVLKQLDYEKYEHKYNNMKKRIVDTSSFFPIRIISYDVGALLLKLVLENVKNIDLSFDEQPFSRKLLEGTLPYKQKTKMFDSIKDVLIAYEDMTDSIVKKAIEQNEIVAEGMFELLGVNIYNARFQKPYIISTFFVMYSDDGEEVIKQGNFVIELDDNNKIKRIYKYT